MRHYLYIDQLAEVTPWSPAAIRTMIARGVFREGVHYFKPAGHNSRPIFSWAAVVKYIEEGVKSVTSSDVISLSDGTAIKLDEAARKIQGLHG